MHKKAVKIIVVEDDENVLEITARAITDKGYHVITATNSEDALIAIRKDKPQIALIDVDLPGAGGIELCKMINQDKNLPKIYTILISGKLTSEQTRIEGLNIGADAYLLKPISTDEILAWINVFIRIKTSEDELKHLKDNLEKLVKERTEELQNRNEELERYNKLFVGREFRIKELKEMVINLQHENRNLKDV